MFQERKKVAIATVFVMASTLVISIPAQQPGGEGVEDPEGTAHITYSGGAVRAKRAVTRDTPTTITESVPPTTWKSLSLATITYTVPTGFSELFNVAFSAECRLFSGGGNDYLRIRILDNGAPMEPYDTVSPQSFCSEDSWGTYKGNWVKRVNTPGLHTIQVQFWIFDSGNDENISAWIDDWTFELVVYD